MIKQKDFGNFFFRSRLRYLGLSSRIGTVFFVIIFFYFLLPINNSLGQTTEINNGLVITANRIEFNQDQQLMKATGNVQIHFDENKY